MHVPDGWFEYSRFGTPIGETKIICVKTPLKQAFNNGMSRGKMQARQLDRRRGVPVEEEFTPSQLVERLSAGGWSLKAVIDLTFTTRYYSPKELEKFGVQYSKTFCPGQEIPNDEVYSKFASNLSGYLTSCENSDVVAVHCTHGLNRTGYLVCRYLVENFSYSPDAAIDAFNRARGHNIERENYLEHLRKGCPPLPPSQKSGRQFQRGAQAKPRQQDVASHSVAQNGHKQQWKKDPQPSNPDPVPLFPSHQPSAEGAVPVPHSRDQVDSHEDAHPSLNYDRHYSVEAMDESSRSKKRSKKRSKRKQFLNAPSTEPPASMAWRNERDSFSETSSSFSTGGNDHDYVEPEEQGTSDGPWTLVTQTRSSSGSSWMQRDQGRDGRLWSHDHGAQGSSGRQWTPIVQDSGRPWEQVQSRVRSRPYSRYNSGYRPYELHVRHGERSHKVRQGTDMWSGRSQSRSNTAHYWYNDREDPPPPSDEPCHWDGQY